MLKVIIVDDGGYPEPCYGCPGKEGCDNKEDKERCIKLRVYEGQEELLSKGKTLRWIDDMLYQWITQVNEKPICIVTTLTQNGKTFSEFIQERIK